jgi:AcrR family transcriptional regulator
MALAGNGQEPQPREHVVETATRLFAALGYDATPIEAIANASGFDVPTITALVGGKETLYRAVIHHATTRQLAMFDAVIAELTPDRAGLHQLADRALDYCVAHPELLALWMHRWQSDAADIPEIEGVYLLPKLERLRAFVRKIVSAEDVDVDLALQTIAWTVRGFCVGGVLNSQGERDGPENSILLERFRQHLHRLTDVLLEPDR